MGEVWRGATMEDNLIEGMRRRIGRGDEVPSRRVERNFQAVAEKDAGGAGGVHALAAQG